VCVGDTSCKEVFCLLDCYAAEDLIGRCGTAYPTFNGQTVKEAFPVTAWPLNVRPIGSPETSTSNHIKTLKTEDFISTAAEV
jgi:hypothetical protein